MKRILLTTLILLTVAFAANAQVYINEFMADNDTIVADQDGEYDDWVELYNSDSVAADISGYYLTDDKTDLVKWQFPNGTTIPANGFLLVWCDADLAQTGLHADFKLGAGGEEIVLADSSTNIIDSLTFGPQGTDTSYARMPDGTGAFQFDATPTPNASNLTMTGFDELLLEYSLYPNPAIDVLNINVADQDDYVLNIYSTTGELVLTESFNTSTSINVAQLSKGMYVVEINGSTKSLILD